MIKKKEIFGLLIVIVVLFIIMIILKVAKKNGDVVNVRIDGELVAVYELNKDAVYELNNGTNILCIKNKQAYLLSANCPDKLCIKQGKIENLNESIVCLPNKLSITIGDK